MAYHGPVYGLSRECHLKAQAKFDVKQAKEALEWIRDVTKIEFETVNSDGLFDQFQFADVLKDGIVLCTLINCLAPETVPFVNTKESMKGAFKQIRERENLEFFLKGCEAYGMKNHDLFQVNDLYERRNLYMVVNCIYAVGGLSQKKSFNGPVLGARVSKENRRSFSKEVLQQGEAVLSLQSGSNKGATQHGMTPYGGTRQIIPNGR